MAELKKKMAAKLAALKSKREEARAANHDAVVEEDRVAKLPKNYEARKRKAEWEEADLAAREAAKARGEDYDRVKAREMSALEGDRIEYKKKKKAAKADVGFTDYAQMQHRHYAKLTDELKPDMAAYKRSQREWGDDEVTADTLAYGQHDKVTSAGLDRLVKDLDKQVEKRSKFSRRRAVLQDSDVDAINERNRNFNKKLERFYGQHTREIKDNLERGTAV